LPRLGGGRGQGLADLELGSGLAIDLGAPDAMDRLGVDREGAAPLDVRDDEGDVEAGDQLFLDLTGGLWVQVLPEVRRGERLDGHAEESGDVDGAVVGLLGRDGRRRGARAGRA